MEALAGLFKALSDETRVQILASLQMRGELCVCDVEGALGISQSKSSRHLRYLLNAGLVLNRRAGAWVYYRLPEAPGQRQQQLLAGLSRLIGPEALDGLRRRLDDWFVRKTEALSTCCDR